MASPLEVRAPGFVPSTGGLHFPNYYPHEPELVVHLPFGKNLPFGLNPYIQLMEPAFPDVSPGFGIPSRATVMLNTEWPNIKADLDAGHPVPLGLIKVKPTHL